MDPQWSVFQPPISEPSVLDYSRSFSSLQTQSHSFPTSSSQSRYSNGFYDTPPPNPYFPPQADSRMSSYHSSQSYGVSSPSFPPPPTPTLCSSVRPHSHQPPCPPPTQSGYYSGNNNFGPPPPPPPAPTTTQASVTDFKIGTFTLNANGFPCESNETESSGSSNIHGNLQANGSSTSQSARETGIIEKLLQTYGFIQCCERQARLFFHFSQFDGNTEHLRIGDPVEFEVTFDRRTGKPIASAVTKISPEVQVLSEERVVGIVTTELRSESNGEQQGRITYENRGECFFLPYGKEDVEGYVTLKPGDRVSFQISTNQRTGNLAARHVRLENPVKPVKYQGVISALKDTYGFIERADVVDEIFFHFSEMKNMDLHLGDDVEFLIQTRNGKEVATNLVKLPPGTVVFEDINPEEMRGQVLKPVEKTVQNSQKDPLTGRIRYRGKDRSEVEVKFGEHDQIGEFTLRHGDWVKFNLTTDRRDHLQKATNISLLDESFHVSMEKREQGLVSTLRDGFGYIVCTNRSAPMYFCYKEFLDPHDEIHIEDEVEFSVVQDQSANSPSLCAIRIRKLPPGTIKHEKLLHSGLEGTVTKEASSTLGAYSPLKPSSAGEGCIAYEMDGPKTIRFYLSEGEISPLVGDRVQFDVSQVKRTKELIATNVKVNLNPATVFPLSNVNDSYTDMPSSHQSPSVSPGRKSPSLGVASRTESRLESDFVTHFLYGQSSHKTVVSLKHDAPVSTSGAPSTVADTQPQLESSVPSASGASLLPNGCPTPLVNGSEDPPAPLVESKLKSDSPPPVVAGQSSFQSRPAPQLPIHQGYIAALKDTFGFIETINHDREIFFHFSNVDGNTSNLELGQEVEYTVSPRVGPGGKVSAENVRILPMGSLPVPKILGEVFEGIVLRAMRSVNPDQQEYCGLVCVGKEEDKRGRHQFGITGVVNKRELLQPGDQVTFQLDVDGWAVNIRSVRKKLIATVDAVKGQYGFLSYETEEGKKLFFHQSEVKDGVMLSPGDEVQFVIITNQKTGKSSAWDIQRIMSNNVPAQRPTRLISRLKNMNLDSSKPRIQVIRQPKGPNGTAGFKLPRSCAH